MKRHTFSFAGTRFKGSGKHAAAMHFFHGNFGILFFSDNGGLLRPKVFRKMSPAEFERMLRRVKYLNNVIEQDNRFIKKKVRVAQCFKGFYTAERTLEGIEAMNMIRNGQVKR